MHCLRVSKQCVSLHHSCNTCWNESYFVTIFRPHGLPEEFNDTLVKQGSSMSKNNQSESISLQNDAPFSNEMFGVPILMGDQAKGNRMNKKGLLLLPNRATSMSCLQFLSYPLLFKLSAGSVHTDNQFATRSNRSHKVQS